MPNWKKVILSGSNAALNNLVVNDLTVGGTFSGTTGVDDNDWHQTSDGLILTASKDVQITGSLSLLGTTSPGSLLSLAKGDATVYDSTDDDGQRNVGPTILLENTSSVSNTFGQILFDSDDSDQGIARIAFLDTGVASTDIAFVTEHTNTKSEKLRITSDGKVGIGTTTPSFALDVTGSLDTTNNGIVRFGSNGGGDLVFNDNANGSNETAIKFGGNGGISGEGGEFKSR